MLKIFSLALIPTILIGGIVALYKFQDDLIFFPSNERFGDCPDLTALGAIPIEKDIDGENIRYYWKEDPKALATLIFFHGNAGSACDRSLLVRELAEIGLNIALVEYPGYGNDGRKAGEAAWLKNARFVFQDIEKKNHQNQKIFIFGESIGTAVATKIAADHQVDGLILQSPFTSLKIVAKRHYPWLPVDSFLIHSFEADGWARLVRSKVLVIHGDQDRVIPIEMGKEQAGNFLHLESMVIFDGYGHNDLQLNHDAYWNAVREFVLKIIASD